MLSIFDDQEALVRFLSMSRDNRVDVHAFKMKGIGFFKIALCWSMNPAQLAACLANFSRALKPYFRPLHGMKFSANLIVSCLFKYILLNLFLRINSNKAFTKINEHSDQIVFNRL